MYGYRNAEPISKISNQIIFKKQVTICNSTKLLEVVLTVTEDCKESAYRFLHDAYVEEGFIKAQTSGMHKTKYSVKPDTILFNGYLDGKLSITTSAFTDSMQGIPANEIFREEMDEHRKSGREIVEVGALASVVSSVSVFNIFQNAIVRHLNSMGYKDIFIMVHPKVENAYAEKFGLVTIAGPKPYPAVNNNPAVLMRLDLTHYCS